MYLGGPDSSFELVGIGSLNDEPFAQGRYISDGGQHVIFTTGSTTDPLGSAQSNRCFSNPDCEVHQLEPDAPPTGTGAVYDREADGKTRVVSLLPGDIRLAAGEDAFYKGTAKDATSTAFTIDGTLYVRVDNDETLEVAGGEPTFAGISEEGRYVFYVVAGDIHRFDTEADADADAQINSSGDAQITNVSGDGSHVYFISDSQLDGTKGTAGQPNLYVWSGASPEYVTTVLASDLERTSGNLNGLPGLAHWTDWVANPPKNGAEQGPGAEASRTTPDGTVLVFESRAQLTDYNNAGHTEIYRYDDSDKSLGCVSCGRAGFATADARLQELILANMPTVIHNVTDDGSRVFFETKEALASRDTDGINDIYEWQEDQGAAVVELISSGQSAEYPLPPEVDASHIPTPNVLLSVTPDGEDIVFLSQDVLVPGASEGGTAGIYDARVNGGFPVPPTVTDCLGEECKPAAGIAPALLSPQSEITQGRGNVKPRKRHRCRRHTKHKKKRRCAKHKSKRARSAAVSLPGAEGRRVVQPTPSGSGLTDEASEPTNQTDASASASPILSAGPFDEFGIKSVSAENSTTTAAAHPDFTTEITLNHFVNESTGKPEASAATEEVSVSLPPGLLGNPNAIPKCSMGQLVAWANCPISSQVGVTVLRATLFGNGDGKEPIYNLEPPHPDKEIARFGFFAGIYPAFIDIKVRTADDYGVTATVHSAPGLTALLGAKTTLWGNPADSSHDAERITAHEASQCENAIDCAPPGGKRPSGIPLEDRKPFLTNPSACQKGAIGFAAKSYQLPGQVFEASAPLAPITDCTGLPFAPSFSAEPTSHVAGAPTGLKTTLTLPQHLGPDERSTATMREARVTLPAGLQIAAGAANWIGTCSEEQVGYHREVDAACPDASKLGTAKITSPALSVPIEGSIYQRNPSPGHQFGLWLTADALGMHIKLPGELEPDKTTGRLTAVFRDLPQVPVEQIELDVWGGPRAPLQNPSSCGTYTTDFSFAPHSSDQAATGQSSFTIDQGCNQGFSPTLHAGVTEPIAGRFSPFVFDLTRDDGQQALRGFELTLPDGELAKLAGVPLCPDDAAAAGSCPAASRIGSLRASTGPGPDPLQIPQPGRAEPQIHLAGPYQGAPFSIVSQVPAQAGPFDLGTLAVRSGLDVDSETARATVKVDPLPQFFEGVGIAYRRLHAVIDRPDFSLNPTDCREMAVTAEATSTLGAVAHPAARFQVDGCKALKFKPRLSLKLRGGTKRAAYPALTAVLKARKGDANIARASAALPRSEFLAQEHIQTICTRVQFAADQCPKGSVYGKAKAWTPLLDKPLSGPVYLRSSNHPLPDMVAAMDGQLEIDLVGRIDSKNGGIRTTFDAVPDAPVSRFVLQMKGGKKGLLVNSTDICQGSHRATVAMRAQNGRVRNLRPKLAAAGCGGKKKSSEHKRHHR